MSDITITTGAVDSSAAPAPTPAPSTPITPPSDTGSGVTESSAAPAESDRPLSFADALARREQQATPTDPTAAAATPGVPPIAAPDSLSGTADPNAPPAEKKGPIPFERHEAVLENARTKTREEVITQVQQEYGEHIRLGEAFRTNPVEAAIQVLTELQQNPAYAPQLTSLAARMLSQRRGQQAEAMPAPDLTGVDGNGQQVQFYSAEQQAKRDAWMANRLMSQFRQEVAPLQQAHQQTLAQQRQAEQAAAIQSEVSGLVEAWSAQPGFAENKVAIADAQAQFRAKGYDVKTALGLAYAQVVLPRLQAHAQTSLRTEAARKAAGSTDNPAAVAPTTGRRSRTFAEALEKVSGGLA